MALCFKWSMSKHCVAKIILTIWETVLKSLSLQIYIIPANLITDSLLSLCTPFAKTKNKKNFSTNCCFGYKNHLCVLFIVSCTLLQRHAEFNNYCKRILLYVASVHMWWFARFANVCIMKKREKKHGGVLLWAKLQTSTCNVLKSNTSLPWFYSKLCRWYQVVKSVLYIVAWLEPGMNI